jgi:LysR family transcriptional regulator, low CO2-responsive transcriptional regulator
MPSIASKPLIPLPLLPHLETFVEAAECSGFTAAARSLGISQAAVSQRIQQLESALGCQLFIRRNGGATLADAGVKLHEYARRILDLHNEACDAIKGKRIEVTGELVVAASSVPGEHLLPPLLAAFNARYPKVSVRLLVSDSAVVLDQLERREAHLGFVGNRSDRPGFDYRPFACDSLVAVVSPKHRWVRRKRVSISELLDQRIVQREIGSGSRVCLEAALSAAGHQGAVLKQVMELSNNEAVKQAVAQNLGVAVLSERAVARELASNELHAVKVDGLNLKRHLHVVTCQGRVTPKPARLLLDFLPPPEMQA